MKLFTLLSAVLLTGSIFLSHRTLAGSATWKLHPTIPYWPYTTSWEEGTIPNGPDDIATFGLSFKTEIGLNTSIQVNSIIFTPAATTAYVINPYSGSLTLTGTGIINNSGITQTFYPGDYGTLMFFKNSATAGSLTNFVSKLSTTEFDDSSTAGEGTFNCNVKFYDNSTANIGTFTTIGGSQSNSNSDAVEFFENSTAANGTFTNNGATLLDRPAGKTSFFDISTAANSVLIANGGTGSAAGGVIAFSADSTGGTARVEVFDNGSLDIADHNPTNVTIGSLEGSGLAFLGANNLTTGSNNVSTTFSGTISDGDVGSGGSLAKIGTGNLTLTGANTYTGGTIVSGGILLANIAKGSGTGSGSVRVTAGTFGGGGKVSGAVTLGTGSGPGAFLGPGATGVIPGTLTIRKKLTLMADATYKVTMNSSSVTADKVSAKGVNIRGAQILLDDRATSVLPIGTVFTVINNTAATPISGAFANLADGATVIVGNNTFQANYEGGDGNDLTLTAVP